MTVVLSTAQLQGYRMLEDVREEQLRICRVRTLFYR